jgi:hypothetical protein
MSLEITYRYSPLEYLLAHCYTVPRMPIVKVAFVLIVAINILLSFMSDHDFVFKVIMASMGTIFGMGTGLIFVTFMMVITSWSRKEQSVAVNESGVRVTTGDKEVRASWTSFLKLHVSGRFVFVKVDNGCHMAIPRRAFESEGAEEAYVNLIESKVRSS